MLGLDVYVTQQRVINDEKCLVLNTIRNCCLRFMIAYDPRVVSIMFPDYINYGQFRLMCVSSLCFVFFTSIWSLFVWYLVLIALIKNKTTVVAKYHTLQDKLNLFK